MLQWILITVTLLAFLTSVLTIGFGVATELWMAEPNRDIRHMLNVVGGLAAAFMWFVAAFGTTSIEVVESGITTVSQSTAATYLFGGFGVFMLIVALLGTSVLLNVTDIAENEPFRP